MGADDDLERRADIVDIELAKRQKRAQRDAKVQERVESDDRSVIDYDGGLLPANVDRMEALLAKKGADIYQRAGELVRVTTAAASGMTGDTSPQGVQRDPDAPVIVRLRVDGIRVAIGRVAQFRCAGDTGVRLIDCPKDYAAALLGLGAWPTIRSLAGVVSFPVLRPDGTIAQTPGYDPITGLLIHIAPDWPTVPEAPTKVQARAALDELLEPFREFPFADEFARAALASAILSRLVRSILPTCPAYFFTAPDVAAGKTLLTDAINIIGSGVMVAKSTLPENDPEMRKVLTACLLAGDAQISFDNAPRGKLVGYAALDAALTSGWWKDRVLGTNTEVSLPFTPLVTFSGNNVGPWGDMVRRSIGCRLEQAEPHEYAIPDLLGYLRAHRRRLVVAGLTVLRAYIAAGRPFPVTPLKTFEVWSRLVRDPLVWLDMYDPVLTQRGMRAVDDDRTDLGELIAALQAAFWDKWFAAADVHARCYPDIPPGLLAQPQYQALRTAMRCDESRHHVSALSMGRRLRKHAGRTWGGRRIESRENSNLNCLEYRVC